MRHSSKKRRSFRYVPEKMLAFSRESDRINVKLFLRCGQMFAKKGCILRCKDTDGSSDFSKRKTCRGENNDSAGEAAEKL